MPTPSLLIVPARFKTGKLYSQIPTSGAGDFTVTRNTEARRFGPDGLIASVASGIPRLDYYTSGGVTGCPALLVEPAATNSILQSTSTASGWTLFNSMTRATIDVIGVSGVNLTVGASGGIGNTGSRYQSAVSSPVNLASGSTYTFSFLLKKTTAHTIGGYLFVIAGATTENIGGGFDVSGSYSSGSIANPSFVTNRIRRVEPWGADVFRCSETWTMTASGTIDRVFLGILGSVSSSNSAPTGTTIGFAAPQLELGSVPTSFIPTTTGSVTRNADVVSVSGAVSGSIGQTEGTIYMEVDVRNLGFAREFISVQDSSYAINAFRIESDSANSWRVQIRAANSSVLDQIISSPKFTTGIYKIAFAYNNAASGVVFAVNGTVIYTSASALTMPTGVDRVILGTRLTSGSFDLFLNDRIRAAALYTTRLTNAELQSLTAL